MKWIASRRSLVACLFSLMLSAAVGIRPGTAASDAPAPTAIQMLQLQGEGAGVELLIATSAPTTYTSYKSSAPARLVIDFSQTAPADGLATAELAKGPVKGIALKRFDTDAGVLTRMEIYLNQDIDPVITPVTEGNGGLKVSFPGYQARAAEPQQPQQPAVAPEKTAEPAVQPAAPAAAEAAVAPPKEVESAVTQILAGEGGILIKTTAPVSDYKVLRLNKPERVVIDLPHTRAAVADRLVQLNAAGVSTARVGSYPDKVRIVLDAINGSLPDATVSKAATGLLVTFHTPAAAAPHHAVTESGPAGAAQPEAAPVKVKPEPPVAVTPAPKPEKPAKVAAPPAVAKKTADEPAIIKQVSAVDFQVLQGVSRITVKTSGNPAVELPVKGAGLISFKVKGALLPRNLQRSLEAREFATPVLRVTPVQVRTKSGSDVLIRVAMRRDAAFELKQESDLAVLDIPHPADAAMPEKAAATQKAAPAAAVAEPEPAAVKAADAAVPQTGLAARRFTGRKVTLEFADAEVRKIFQLLSEVSNKNFVLGDEVGGTISLKLVNVPWDQALDIILDTKGLDKREEGNIILVRGKGKFKSIIDEEVEIRKAALKGEPLSTEMFDVNYADLGSIVTQFSALKTDRGMITQDTRTNKIIVKDVKTAIDDMRKILSSLDVPEKQVMIEARIVEASTQFTQSLGVNWGIHYRDGSASIAGINSMDTSFGGLATNVAPANGVSGNPGATAGISFGTLSSNIKLDMRLNAAVSAGLVRIVSTPKVATLNHKSAKITQGQQIPYTSATSDKIETKFIEAALSLEVTPHINPNGTLVMKIDAKNDSPGASGSPPPINKKQATTEMMLRDGETTVIGGIYVESETSGEDGVPYLKDVPWLGGLFKSTDQKRNRTELLIFITPRILNGLSNS